MREGERVNIITLNIKITQMKWVSPVERRRRRRRKRACLGALQKTKKPKTKNTRGERKGAADRCVSHTRHTCWHLTPSSCKEREREKSLRIVPALCDDEMWWEIPNRSPTRKRNVFRSISTPGDTKVLDVFKMFQGEEEEEGGPHDKNLFCFLSLSLFIPKWRKKFDLIFYLMVVQWANFFFLSFFLADVITWSTCWKISPGNDDMGWRDLRELKSR